MVITDYFNRFFLLGFEFAETAGILCIPQVQDACNAVVDGRSEFFGHRAVELDGFTRDYLRVLQALDFFGQRLKIQAQLGKSLIYRVLRLREYRERTKFPMTHYQVLRSMLEFRRA